MVLILVWQTLNNWIVCRPLSLFGERFLILSTPPLGGWCHAGFHWTPPLPIRINTILWLSLVLGACPPGEGVLLAGGICTGHRSLVSEPSRPSSQVVFLTDKEVRSWGLLVSIRTWTPDSSENKGNKSSQELVQLIFNIWSFLLHVSKERA